MNRPSWKTVTQVAHRACPCTGTRSWVFSVCCGWVCTSVGSTPDRGERILHPLHCVRCFSVKGEGSILALQCQGIEIVEGVGPHCDTDPAGQVEGREAEPGKTPIDEGERVIRLSGQVVCPSKRDT